VAIGFLLALAAAGIELSQAAILVGGLGVGIGLGLQDIVKNFAAGLTVLFERRVHVGDVVEVPASSVHGRVLEIGVRATVVRTWDGAEVVVPNADFVSGAITNWTLSDPTRRIEVPVGVAYGTEPDRVIELLTAVTAKVPGVIAYPAAQVVFQGFGDSSLDFTVLAWTDQAERILGTRSEIALAIHRALREAGIVIPFPQRDLHLASVSPSAREALTAPGAPNPRRP
jgi:small-conductance mechanosensitive channel